MKSGAGYVGMETKEATGYAAVMSTAISSIGDLPDGSLPGRLGAIARSPWFSRFILLAIALTGILSGLETYPAFRGAQGWGAVIDWIQHAILAVFVVEIVIRIGAHGSRPWRYFRNGWNVFDFTIVAVSLLPIHAEYLVVLRLLRLLRLFTALQGLQILLSGLIRGLPSLGYVGLLLLLHFYIYAVIGTFEFGDNDPVRFGTLHNTMLTLFQVLTLEGWNDILSTQQLGSDVGYDDGWKQLPQAADRVSVARPVEAAVFFVSFILIGTMIVLNLFTGVIIRSMEEANIAAAEESMQRRLQGKAAPDPRDELRQVSEQLQAIAKRLDAIQSPPRSAAKPPEPT